MKKKRTKTAFAVLLATVAIILCLGSMITYAAVAVEWIPLDKQLDYAYAPTFDTTSKTVAKGEGFTNFKKGLSSAYWDGGNPDGWVTLDATETSLKGKAKIRYPYCGKYDVDGDGVSETEVDIVVTVMDWGTVKENWYLKKNTAWNTGGEKFSYQKILPHIAFNSDDIALHIIGVHDVTCKYEIVKHGTTEVLPISFHTTLSDLDVEQAFQFKNDSNVTAAYIAEGNTHLTVKGSKIISQKKTTEIEDTEGWVTVHSKNGTTELTFYYGGSDEDFNDVDETYQGIEINNIGVNWDEDGKKWVEPTNTASLDWYGFTAKSIGKYPIPKPQKNIGDVGFSWDGVTEPTAISQETAYTIPEDGIYEYVVAQKLTPNRLQSFVFQDVLEDCLIYKNLSITDDRGRNVAKKFQIDVVGGDITATALQEEVVKDSFCNNRTYFFRIQVQLDKSKIDNYYNPIDGFRYYIPNVARMKIVDEDKIITLDDITTTVWAQGEVVFTPIVNKTTPYEHQVRDQVPYEVTLQVKEAGTFGKNIVISDLSLPSGLAIQSDSLQASGVEGASILPEGNGWRVTLPMIQYGEVLTIKFNALVMEEMNGKEITNTVTVTADNIDPDGPIEGDLDIDEWNNSPRLTIKKDVEKYEYKVGETACYTVVVMNNVDGTIAKNVVVDDSSLPKDFIVAPDSVKIDGLPEKINYPVQDSTHKFVTEERQNNCIISSENNQITVKMDYLPAAIPITITFSCTTSEMLNGMEIKNTATASAENVQDTVCDDAIIWINTPMLKVEKKADKKIYRVGDVITYTVVGIQEQIGCVARKITFEDTIETEGVKLQKNSIVLMDEEGNAIKPIELEVKGNHFKLSTGRDLIHPENYFMWDRYTSKDTGVAQENYNPLKITKEKGMTLEYQVVIIDDKLAGQNVVNKIIIDSEENNPKEDPEEVPVYGPILDLEKVSDKTNAKIGETVHYTLQATQERDGPTADNVVIIDQFLKEVRDFVEIQLDTLTMKLDEKILEGAEITYEEGVIIAKSNHNLAYGEKLTLEYDVKIIEATDSKIINQAEATSDNANPAKDDNEITVGEDKPVLQQEKTSDKESVKVGEMIHYTVTTKQIQEGAKAVNVVLTDEINSSDLPYVEIQEKSIQVKVDEKEIEGAEITYQSGKIIVNTHYDLAAEETMTLEYDMKYVKVTENKIRNSATAKGDNAAKVDSNHDITPVQESVTPTPTNANQSTEKSEKVSQVSSQGNSNRASTVKTGDNTLLTVTMGIFLLAAVVLTIVVFIRRWRRE